MEKFCLYYAFSEDVAARADEVIRATNINLFTGSEVKQILGEKNHVKAVLLDDGIIEECPPCEEPCLGTCLSEEETYAYHNTGFRSILNNG